MRKNPKAILVFTSVGMLVALIYPRWSFQVTIPSYRYEYTSKMSLDRHFIWADVPRYEYSIKSLWFEMHQAGLQSVGYFWAAPSTSQGPDWLGVLMDWIILIVFAILLYWIDRAYYDYLIKKNLCIQCKYDLSHSPETCPECGMPKPNEQIRCHTTN